MFYAKIRKILLFLSVSILMMTLGGIFMSCSCANNESGKEEKDIQPKVYGLVADFENYDEVSKFTFDWYFGAASINTDKKYITSGAGSLKVTDTRSTARMVVPLSGVWAATDYSDTYKLKEIQLDVYNASADVYTLSLTLLYKNGLVSAGTKTFVLQPDCWTTCSWQPDVRKTSISADLDEASELAINFEQNSGKEKTVYLDRLQFYYSDTAVVPLKVELDKGELCSFEKDWQEYAVYSSIYSTTGAVVDYLPITSINTDAEFVKEGEKSLKMVCPAGAKNRYPYIAFSLKVLEKANLAQYGNNAALSFWVYNAYNKNFYLILDFFRKNTTVQRGFHYPTIEPGWNKIVLPFAEINSVDEGVDLLTENLADLRLVYESFAETDTLKEKVLYFDDFKIITGDAVYEDIVQPVSNKLYDLDVEQSRNALMENIAGNFKSNAGTITISDEQSATENGYCIKLSGLEDISSVRRSWLTFNFEKLTTLLYYIQNTTEYKNNDVLAFKMRTAAGNVYLCKDDAKQNEGGGYKTFGISTKEYCVTSDGWTTVTCPVSDILNNQVQMYLTPNVNALYFDDIELLTSYKITWNYNGETLAVTKAIKGEKPAYTGTMPAIAPVGGVGKVFAGWTPEIVPATKNTTYTAVFNTSYKPTDENVYRFEAYATGTDVSSEFGGVSAVIDDTITVGGTGKSVKYTVAGATEWGVLRFTELLNNLSYARSYLKTATKMQLKMHIEGTGSVLLCGDHGIDNNYLIFGKSYERVSVSKTGWTTVLVDLASITDNQISYYSSGACYLYIDEVKLLKNETFTWKNDDGSILATVQAVPGTEVYEGGTPVSAIHGADATFTGWAKTAEYEYTANYVLAKNLLNGLVLNYCSDKPYNAQNIAEWAEEQISSATNVVDYSRPEGVELSWSAIDGVTEYTVLVSENADMTNAWEFTATENKYTVYNLKAGERYYWQVKSSNYQGEVAEFATLGYAPRLIVAGGATNVRDLGGWATSSDGSTRIQQGLIYRSATLSKLTASGINVLKNQLGIKTEIDLRNETLDNITMPDEGMGNGALGAGVYYYKCNLTWNLTSDNNAAEVRKLFEILADENNYPIIFHCSQGADRTGYVAYIIERLLGVNENDMYKDFLITNFSKQTLGTRRNAGSVWAYAQIINGFSGATASEKCFNYLIANKGVSAENINKVKAILNGATENAELWISYPQTTYYDYAIEVYKDGKSVNLNTLQNVPTTHVKAYTIQNITAFAEANLPDGYYIQAGKSTLKTRITEDGTIKLMVYYEKLPVGGLLYDFDGMTVGEKISGNDNKGGEINVYYDSNYADVSLTDEEKFGDAGNSVKADVAATSWGTVRFNYLEEYIAAAKVNMPEAQYLQFSMRLVSDGTATLSTNFSSYSMFGASTDGDRIYVRSSDGEWTTFIVLLSEITHNRFLYALSGSGTLYIDDVRIVETAPVNPYAGGLENGGNYDGH